MQKRVELLAPAGGYETMVGAFNAGADAVYLGGSKFGARAYADNFDTQQVLDAISYAHLHGKKIYMTVNTLVKEKEFGQVYDFMLPFAEKNLDGVIVQDYGVMRLIRDEFPNVELHASTQQTVTGVYGARLLKELGCCRVVPARELSLMEMKAIREKADVEVEAFIHGAMCYCYSGVCLFSSMVGERSGNRGRCAQPCRLPYQLQGKGGVEAYPLSLKDMCTIDMIPELIKAGIDSFKIEGRMKKPEYAAGVTALYRKYIDMYYADPSKDIKVSDEDMEILKGLYLRTGISEGYYHQHNGRNMVTISSPAYNGTSDKVLAMVKDKFLQGEQKIKCTIDAYLTLDEAAVITMTVNKDGEELVETVTGSDVQAASKRPMDEAAVIKQLDRLGNTPFVSEAINVTIEDKGTGTGIFVPASELNELRRVLTEQMLQRLSQDAEAIKATDVAGSAGKGKESCVTFSDELNNKLYGGAISERKGDYHILVNTRPQLKAALNAISEYGAKVRIYVDSDLYFNLDDSLADKVISFVREDRAEFIVALPYVTREEEFDGTIDILDVIENADSRGFTGVLVRNLEQLGFIREHEYKGTIILDYGVYVWNQNAAALLSELNSENGITIDETSVPLELTIHEAKELAKALDSKSLMPRTYNIYGRTPMMVSAGCVKKTMDKCSGKLHEFNREEMKLVDRMGNVLPVTTNCRNCLNVIWNAHPTSLHKKLDNIRNMQLFDHFRIDLTTESMEESALVLGAFLNGDRQAFETIEQKGYTTGHFKREVE